MKRSPIPETGATRSVSEGSEVECTVAVPQLHPQRRQTFSFDPRKTPGSPVRALFSPKLIHRIGAQCFRHIGGIDALAFAVTLTSTAGYSV